MTQPKRRKCNEFDDVTQQSQQMNHIINNDPIMVDNGNSSNTTDATFNLPLMNTPADSTQSTVEEDKNRQFMNFNNNNVTSNSYTNALTNFSSFNCNTNDYNNSMNWFQPISFDNHEIEDHSNILSTQADPSLHHNEVSTTTNHFQPQTSPKASASLESIESIENSDTKSKQSDIMADLSKTCKSIM